MINAIRARNKRYGVPRIHSQCWLTENHENHGETQEARATAHQARPWPVPCAITRTTMPVLALKSGRRCPNRPEFCATCAADALTEPAHLSRGGLASLPEPSQLDHRGPQPPSLTDALFAFNAAAAEGSDRKAGVGTRCQPDQARCGRVLFGKDDRGLFQPPLTFAAGVRCASEETCHPTIVCHQEFDGQGAEVHASAPAQAANFKSTVVFGSSLH